MRKIINQPKRQGTGVLYLQIYIIFLNLAKKYLHFFHKHTSLQYIIKTFYTSETCIKKKKEHILITNIVTRMCFS